ncbi:MAG: thermonuclease family protein [Cyanosarcina radialis HA8281-LM2]|jgi:endonuclease YncB( thermonuclease family)|nr:thermonuclease family protein [Cyanosarcina radialis HA8281-LM2]
MQLQRQRSSFLPITYYPSALLRASLLLITFLLLLGLVGCDRQAISKGPTYAVRHVSDGDTIAVSDRNGQNFTVRFACMDAPEIPHTKAEKFSKKGVDKNQFKWGRQAQQRLQQLINRGGSQVLLTVTDSDRYGRKVSEVRLPDGTLLQQILVREGLALVYQPYLKNCPSANIVLPAEKEAQQSRRGVWQDSKFVVPWEYRREKRN